jgi:hypothetical protein
MANTNKEATNENVFETAETYFHESFIHVDSKTNDYLDNKKLDYSNISEEVKQQAYGYKSNFDHVQTSNDYLKNRNNTNLFPNQAYFGLKEVNQNLNLGHSDVKIFKMIWGFSGSRVKIK